MHDKNLFNTRDLGGLPTADGKKIVHGKLIRSGKLYKLPEKTIDALKKKGVKTIIDLRIPTEKEQKPDTLWEGIDFVELPLICTATAGITHDKSMRRTMVVESKRIKGEFGSADNYMIEMYRLMLESGEPVECLKKALRLIIDNEHCIIWHCSGGKDRAGIVTMLVLSLLGVSREVIIKDYVVSQKFTRKKFFWNKFGLVIAPLTMRFKKILFAIMDAKPVYIAATIDGLNEKYGGVTEYCKQKLGVTDEDIKIMKEKYLQ